MQIAEEKKNTNIAEYIIYMYQLEDLIRACKFDLPTIKEKIVEPQTINPSMLQSSEKWFFEIVREMKSRGLEKKGHINRINEVLIEIVYLHNTLLSVVKDKKYTTLFESASENIEAFRKKSDLGDIHPIEICFQALYMKLLMKLQRKEITAETENAFDTMRVVIAYLSKEYHLMKNGKSQLFN